MRLLVDEQPGVEAAAPRHLQDVGAAVGRFRFPDPGVVGPVRAREEGEEEESGLAQDAVLETQLCARVSGRGGPNHHVHARGHGQRAGPDLVAVEPGGERNAGHAGHRGDGVDTQVPVGPQRIHAHVARHLRLPVLAGHASTELALEREGTDGGERVFASEGLARRRQHALGARGRVGGGRIGRVQRSAEGQDRDGCGKKADDRGQEAPPRAHPISAGGAPRGDGPVKVLSRGC